MARPGRVSPNDASSLAAITHVRGSDTLVWEPFVWAAIWLALLAGFGLGGLLFAVPLVGLTPGIWVVVAAQVHGHVQLFGWTGLMVLGVGLHFLPRLRGRPLARPLRAYVAAVVLVLGLMLRSVAQPLATVSSPPNVSMLVRSALVLSGVLELSGGTLVLGVLLGTARGAPPLKARPGLLAVLPFLITSFAAFWVALIVNLVCVVQAALSGPGLVDSRLDGLTLLIAFNGFVIPIAVGMGARIFPLHFASRHPKLRVLYGGLVCLLVGLALRVIGELAALPLITVFGLVSTAIAYLLFVLGLQVFVPRRHVAGGRPAWFHDAAQWHGVSAFVWLLLDAGLLIFGAIGLVLHGSGVTFTDADRHVLGAGFITMLILGEAAKLLPGFGAGPLRSEVFVWATLLFGNAAALMRVGPELLAGLLPAAVVQVALAASGVAGMFAITLIAVNLRGQPNLRQPTTRWHFGL